jgi:hypothetical protein
MPRTIQSAAEFWPVVEKSGLIGASELPELQRRLSGSPVNLARQLVGMGRITKWQARMLLAGRDRLHVGRYILLERLPDRTPGSWFLAVHSQLRRSVELNLFSSALSRDTPAFRAFLEHASRVAALEHPNLIHL